MLPHPTPTDSSQMCSDLIYDRSVDPSLLTLQDLPAEVLEKVLKPLDIKNRFKIRQVSKIMRSAVDQLKIHYDRIDIPCWGNSVSVQVQAGNSEWDRNWPEESARANFEEIARHLTSILNPTMIRVKTFRILSRNLDQSRPIIDLLLSISKTENAKFHVESAGFMIQELDISLSLLSILKPKVLKELKIGRGLDVYDMNQIKDMQQFKKAKSVDLYGYILSSDLKHFSNFQDFYVEVQSMEPEDAIRLRNELLNNNTFKNGTIRPMTRFENVAKIAKALGADVLDEETLDVKHVCKIENSMMILHFHIHSGSIVIEKGDHLEIAAKYHVEEHSDDDSEFEFDPDFGIELGDDLMGGSLG